MEGQKGVAKTIQETTTVIKHSLYKYKSMYKLHYAYYYKTMLSKGHT